MIVGGGPAGLQAAETAAMIGHNVTVYEAQEEVGGQFRSAAYPIGKGELTTLISVFKKNLEDLHVKVHLNTLVTKEMIEQKTRMLLFWLLEQDRWCRQSKVSIRKCSQC